MYSIILLILYIYILISIIEYNIDFVHVPFQSNFEMVDDNELAQIDKHITELGEEYKTLQSENMKIELGIMRTDIWI